MNRTFLCLGEEGGMGDVKKWSWLPPGRGVLGNSDSGRQGTLNCFQLWCPGLSYQYMRITANHSVNPNLW